MRTSAVPGGVVGLVALSVVVFLPGCCPKVEQEMAEPVAEPEVIEEVSALRGDDIPLAERPEDVVYVEPWVGVFEDTHFEFDKYRIRPEDEPILQRIATWLKNNENVHVLLEGHCDERGTNEYNMALGEQRGLSTRRYLIGLGVEAYRLETISYGEERPFDGRHNEEAWALNRRAHFVVSE